LLRYYTSLTPEAKKKFDISYFQIKDIGNRCLQGTGSLGAGRYYVLIEGNF
jgi:uncharacterized protein (DUF2252 family)